MKISEFRQAVEERTALYCEDLVFTSKEIEETRVEPIHAMRMLGVDGDEEPNLLALRFGSTHEDPLRWFLPTDWAWSQLYSHLGVRPKWFKAVEYPVAAEEIQRRIYTFRNHRVLTMRPADDVFVAGGTLRGFVSKYYATFLDLDIVKLIEEAAPTAVTSGLTGMSDSSLYVSILNVNKKVTIGVGGLTATPCILVRNSEVGACSLSIIPSLLFDRVAGGSVTIPSKGTHTVFRKIHRGSSEKLQDAFKKALLDVSATWGSWADQAPKLAGISWPDEASMLAQILPMFRSYGTKMQGREFAYSYAKLSGPHTGLRVVQAMLSTIPADLDTAYIRGQVAGAIIYEFMSL